MRVKQEVTYRTPWERMSREELEAIQFRRLKKQLEYVYTRNPFYRRKFDEAGITPDDINNRGDFRRKVPFTTKADFIKDQTEHPFYGSRLGVPKDKLIQLYLTGGTSGLGQEIYGLTQADLADRGAAVVAWYWTNVRKGDVGITFLNVGTTTGGWCPIEQFRAAGANMVPLGHFSTEARIQFMLRFKEFHWMFLIPSYFQRLTVVLQKMGIDPAKEFPSVKTIFVSAEPYPIEWGLRMEEVWNATMHEHYGSTQGQVVACTCEKGAVPNGQRGNLHITEWRLYLEVLNPETGEPAAPGEEGEVFLTSLEPEASPVIRCRLMDRVRYFPHNHCDCGRPFDIVEAGTIGRYDDMIKIKVTNVWPQDVDGVLFKYEEIEDYRATVYTDEEGREGVLIRVALNPKAVTLDESSKKALFAQITKEIKDATQVTMELKEVPRESLPEFEFKARRWKDDRLKGLK